MTGAGLAGDGGIAGLQQVERPQRSRPVVVKICACMLTWSRPTSPTPAFTETTVVAREQLRD